MTDRVRFGIVGTSWWADFMHLPALTSDPRIELAAICGRNRAVAAERAEKYRIPQVFTDYREMLARGDLQALVIGTPDDLHYQIAMDALAAGLHVLCEKPLAMNATDARAMYEQAEMRGLKHMTFFSWRWLPYFQYLHELIDGGYLGRCYECQLRFIGGYARGGEYAWRFDQRRANGILGDLGSHLIDLAHWLVGDIASVSAHVAAFVERAPEPGQPPTPANDAAMLLVEFANGAHGTIQASAVAHLAERDMEQQVVLHGELGTLELSVAFGGAAAGPTIRGARHDQQSFETLEIPARLLGGADPGTPFFDQFMTFFTTQPIGVRLFADAILADRPAAPSFYDGLKTQQVIDAALESHQTGRRVAIAR